MRRTPSPVPTGLPMLGGGSHADPDEGACFMEYASMLAGERWSDHPRCTHPALAQLARSVNDGSPPVVRQRLAGLVPEVIGLTGRSSAVTPALVLLCLDRLAAYDLRPRDFRRLHRHAERRRRWATRSRLTRCCFRVSDPLYRNGSALRTMLATVRKLSESEPEALPDLLADAVGVTRGELAAAGAGHGAPGAARRNNATTAG